MTNPKVAIVTLAACVYSKENLSKVLLGVQGVLIRLKDAVIHAFMQYFGNKRLKLCQDSNILQLKEVKINQEHAKSLC